MSAETPRPQATAETSRTALGVRQALFDPRARPALAWVFAPGPRERLQARRLAPSPITKHWVCLATGGALLLALSFPAPPAAADEPLLARVITNVCLPYAS